MHGTLPENAKLAEPSYTVGPTIDRSLPIDMTKSPTIKVQRANRTFNIESQRGVITLVETTAEAAPAAPRVVGAGIALAATAGGRYIVALAPRANAPSGESAVEAVVYTVTW
jgi:hypothetical protein